MTIIGEPPTSIRGGFYFFRISRRSVDGSTPTIRADMAFPLPSASISQIEFIRGQLPGWPHMLPRPSIAAAMPAAWCVPRRSLPLILRHGPLMKGSQRPPPKGAFRIEAFTSIDRRADRRWRSRKVFTVSSIERPQPVELPDHPSVNSLPVALFNAARAPASPMRENSPEIRSSNTCAAASGL